MGHKVSCLKGKSDGSPSSPITLAIIGPDNAGKTTLSSCLAGEPIDPQVAPTVGFRNVKFTLQKCDITLYDLGGGKGIRPIWKNYFSEIFGVVYMVDSSSQERIREARDLLRDTLEHPQVSGKPLLVLANKVDVEGHMEEVDLVNQLDLEQTVNSNNCPSRFLMISALQSNKRNMKKIVVGGFMWLLGSIRSSMSSLEPRVKEDMELVKALRDREREERRERVRKQREEREKAEGGEKMDDLDYEEIRKDPYKLLNYNRMKHELQKEEKKRKQDLTSGKESSLDRKDLQRIKDDSNIRYSLDDTMTLPRFGKSRLGRNADLDGLDMAQSSDISLHGRSTRPTALPPLDPITSRSLELKMNPGDKKKGKKKKPEALSYQNDRESFETAGDLFSRYGSKSYDFGKRYGGSDNDEDEVDYGKKGRDNRLGLRSYEDNESDRGFYRSKEEPLGSLQLSKYGSRSRDLESDVHDLTPRNAKPKSYKVSKSGRIDEDDKEDSFSQYKNLKMSLKEYGDPRMSQKLDEYSDKYPLRSSSDIRSNNKYQSKYSEDGHGRKGESRFEREDSMYRKSLKQISPPDIHRFDDDKDEGIEDDTEDNSDNGRYTHSSDKYGRYGKRDSSLGNKYYKDVNANKRRSRYDDDDDDDDQDDDRDRYEYGTMSKLKDTMRFSNSYEDHSRSKYEREINNLKYRRDNDYKNSYYNEDSDEERQKSRTSYQAADQGRKKKKKSILKSNKLQPSDDDDLEESVSQRYSSPRMVQERGSRYSSDADTPSHGRNAVTTSYFSKGSSRDTDFGQKWGLAEDLPAIDNDSRVRRNYRSSRYDDSEEDVPY